MINIHIEALERNWNIGIFKTKPRFVCVRRDVLKKQSDHDSCWETTWEKHSSKKLVCERNIWIHVKP